MSFRIRTKGTDLPTPEGQSVAVDEYDPKGSFVKVYGYASSIEDARNFIDNQHRPESHSQFFADKPMLYLGSTAVRAPDGIDAVATEKALAQADAMQYAEQDEHEVRQGMRRLRAFERLFGETMLKRAVGSHGPNVKTITFEEYRKIHAEYQQCYNEEQAALKSGRQPDERAKDFSFQPLASYAHKLVKQRPDGSIRKIRDPLQNEVGFWTDRDGNGWIMVLQNKGPGDLGEKYHQVPDNYGDDNGQ